MEKKSVPLGFGNISVPLGSHIAAFYRNFQERRAVAVPFIKTGLERGARCTYLIDEETRDELVEALHEVDVEAALASGQLSILTAEGKYLSKGYFSPEETLNFAEVSLRSTMEEGYGEIRIAAEMTWILRERQGVELLAEYEAKFNKLLHSYPHVAICQYNVTRLRGDIILDALRTHPICVLGGVLIPNHFYIPPDEFLREPHEQSD